MRRSSAGTSSCAPSGASSCESSCEPSRVRARARSALLSLAVVGCLAAALATAAPAGASAPVADDEPETIHIAITSKGFQPQGEEIPVGSTVVWTNRDRVVHEVVATDGTFVSGDIRPGFTFTFVFNQPGDFPFRDPRAGFQGAITVGPPGSTTPGTTPTVTTPPAGPPPGQMAFTGAGDAWLALGGAFLALLGVLAVMGTGQGPEPAMAALRSLPFPRIRHRYLADLLPWRLSSRARRRPARGWTERRARRGRGAAVSPSPGPG